jgi:hypothetical protein
MRFRDRFTRKTRTPSTRNQRIGFAFFWLIVLCYAYFIATDLGTGLLGISNPFGLFLQMPSLQAIWQITFGSYRGIFLVSPFLLLFFVALVFMRRNGTMRAEMWLCIGVVAAYFMLDASHDVLVNGWSGGSSVASRHLLPALPFMVMPMAFGLRSPLFRSIFLVTCAASISVMFMTVATVGLFDMNDQNPIVNELFPRFFSGRFGANWGFITGTQGMLSLAPFGAGAAALMLRIVRLHRTHEHFPIIQHAKLELEAS